MHICKFYIYNEFSQDFRGLDIPFMVIFATAARALAHKKGCDPFEREIFVTLRIQLFSLHHCTLYELVNTTRVLPRNP